jgi:hypothetical protein
MFNSDSRNSSYACKIVFFLVRVLVKVRSLDSQATDSKSQTIDRTIDHCRWTDLYLKFQLSRCYSGWEIGDRRTDGRTDGRHNDFSIALFLKICSKRKILKNRVGHVLFYCLGSAHYGTQSFRNFMLWWNFWIIPILSLYTPLLYVRDPAKLQKFQYRACWYSIDRKFYSDDEKSFSITNIWLPQPSEWSKSQFYSFVAKSQVDETIKLCQNKITKSSLKLSVCVCVVFHRVRILFDVLL